MTAKLRTKGFVIKKKDRFESDRVFTVFTEDFGRLEIRAKAIRKIASKLRGGIDFLCLSEIEFIQGKNYKTLTDAVLIEKFNGIKENQEKLETAGKIADILDNLIKGEEKDEKVFSLLAESFDKLKNCQNNKVNCQLVYYYFSWNLFSLLGYSPELYKCAVCQNKLNPSDVYFSCEEGGVMCSQCLKTDRAAKKISPDTVKILRIILKKDWKLLSKLKIRDSPLSLLENISDNYYLYIKEQNE